LASGPASSPEGLQAGGERPTPRREGSMNRDDYFILSKRYFLLQAKYLKLKQELEKFLKKKAGYKASGS